MTHRYTRLRSGSMLLGLLAVAAVASGQTVTATVTGAVADGSGAVVADAAVVAISRDTGVEYPTISNDAGVYTLSGLPIGTYVLRASAVGFKATVTNAFIVEVGRTARVDLTLAIGAMSEELEVASVNPVLQTESAVVGEVITGSTASTLPLNGRNFVQLAMLTPGSVHHDPQSFTEPGNVSGGRPYVNGQREQGNNFMLDGIDLNGAMDNLVAYNPSPDALAEVRVETNSYSAEFGNVAGAVVNSVLKSGTNALHGSLFEFVRNDRFDANSWANNRSQAQKAELDQHIFGGTLGGPLLRNRAFFFADYQGTRIEQPGGATATVAPAEWRTGDFSPLLAEGVVIRDPRTGQAFPGNRVPTDRFSPIARALLADTARYPLPNTTVSGLAGNYAGTQRRVTTNDQADLKLDAKLGPADNVFLRLSVARYEADDDERAFPLLMGTAAEKKSSSTALNWTRTFGASVFNELRLGVSRVESNERSTDWAGIGDYNAALGIGGAQAIAGLSAIVWASSGLAVVGSPAPTSNGTDTVYQLSDKISFSSDRHFITVGGQALYYDMKRSYASNSGELGGFFYSGGFSGFAFSDFLLDQVAQKAIGGAAPWHQTQARVGLFVQDAFRVSSSLTLNFGLRWDYMSPLVEKNDRQVNFDVDTGTALFAGSVPSGIDCTAVRGGCRVGDSRALYDPYYGGVSPRLGLAWTVDRRTVLRGGFGLVQYMEGAGANNRLTQNTPFVPADSLRTYTVAAGSAATGFSDTSAGAPPAVGAGQIRVFDTSLRPQLTAQWNLFLQRQLTDDMSVNAGYVGSRARHLVAFHDANQPRPGTGDPAAWPDAESRRPARDVLPLAAAIRNTRSDAEANYDGLQVSLRHRRSRRLEAMVSYTFSKALSNNPGFYGAGFGTTSNFVGHIQGAGFGSQDSRHPEKEYGPTFFDATHNFVFSASYELPLGRGRALGGGWSGVTQAVLGGWNVSTIATLHSGFPITVTNGSWGGLRSLQPSFGFERPNRVGPNGGEVDAKSWDRWIDPAGFSQPDLGTFGDSGVGILRGPGYFNVDAALDKHFEMGGERLLTLRLEAFNVLNHANKGMPNNDWADIANFGTITSVANAPRILELALKFRF